MTQIPFRSKVVVNNKMDDLALRTLAGNMDDVAVRIAEAKRLLNSLKPMTSDIYEAVKRGCLEIKACR